ncbi:hypothetical protein EV359DRAFT_63379 [Lentinula novae-zelandiae]|nr:hypothetical protein EV359DRAFT_63379 [Lentinula novae-zelandiae]
MPISPHKLLSSNCNQLFQMRIKPSKEHYLSIYLSILAVRIDRDRLTTVKREFFDLFSPVITQLVFLFLVLPPLGQVGLVQRFLSIFFHWSGTTLDDVSIKSIGNRCQWFNYILAPGRLVSYAHFEVPDIVIPNCNVHPSQTVSAFFLGWVFYASISTLLTSLHLKRMIIRLRALLVASTDQDESIIHISVGPPPPSIDQVFSPPAGDNVQRILIIMLFASFVTGGLTNFGSLLSFQNSNLCAFLVTWSILSLDTARLMGLCMLLLALRHLGMKPWELVISLIWLLAGLVFVFINAALATGVTQTIPQLGVSFCFTIARHIFPTSAVVSTSIYLCLEIFVVVRLLFKLPRPQIYRRRGWAYLFNTQIIRALSLVLLDLLTLVPSAITTDTVGNPISYSIGAIGVLHSRVAFSHDADERQLINIQDSPNVSPASALTSGSDSPASTQKDALFSVPAYSTARSIREAVIHQARIGKPSVTDSRDSAMAQFPQRPTAATELAPPRTAVKSLRPKLVIVTKTFHPCSSRPVAQAEEDELSSVFEHRSSAAPSERILVSRFSSPSLATTRSRSTITYPSQILSSSSASRSSEGLIMVDSASGSW